jgi:hypothetical protein
MINYKLFNSVPGIRGPFRGVIFFLFFLLICPTANAEENINTKSDFKYFVPLNGSLQKNNLYQLHLTGDVIKKSENNLEDIRIFDKKGNTLPYVILKNQIPKAQVKQFNLDITEYFQSNGKDFVIARMPEKYLPVSTVELTIDDINFKKEVALSGSNDSKNWQLLKKNTIFDFSSSVPLRKTSIDFKKSNFKYYKIELSNDQGKNGNRNETLQLQYQELNLNLTKSFNRDLRINNITARTETGKEDIIKYDQADFTNLQVSQDEKRNTVINLTADLPADKISFSVANPYYSRQVEVLTSETGSKDSFSLVKSDNIYKISLADIQEKKDYIELSSPKHKFYKFVIFNRDNEPLDISRINFQWVRNDLYIMPRSDDAGYELYLGNKYINMPVYDFGNFLTGENWYLQKFTPVQSGSLVQNPEFKDILSPEEKEKNQKRILIAIVSVTVLILGIWIYRLAGEAGKKPV